ncbi:MAG: hypothetical protein HWD59_15355 [Coxiellaceae bacterium]|nr:MAG: hypothetical protein HWD59_15355 [Coxiellaceae bacterium]
MKIIYKYVVLLMSLILLSGCAATSLKPLSQQNKQSIKAIAIDDHVKVPVDMYYVGPGLGYLMLTGIVGDAIAAGQNSQESKKLKALAENNNIHIDKIVKDNMMKEIKENTSLKIVPIESADAVMNIEIQKYGLSIPTGYATSVEPILVVNAKLVKDNQVVWKDGYYVSPSNMPKHKIGEIENNPVLLAQLWNMAAEKAVQHIIRTLN